MKTKIFYLTLAAALVFSMVAAMVPAEPAAAQATIFSDDFEYDDSIENHGWTIDQGNPHTVIDPADASNRAVYLQSVANTGVQQFSRSFCELPLQPGMEISIRFYDTGDNCNNCDVYTSVYFDNNSKYINVGWYNNQSSFAYYYDFTGSWQGEYHETYGLRSIGWHTFTWRVEQNGGIDLLIDGNLIIDDLMGLNNSPAATLSTFYAWAGSDPSTYSFYVDDFSVTGPAPTVCLDVDGEGLADGTPIPGWDLDYFAITPVATVTATANPVAIRPGSSGSRGVRVNGDNPAGKELDIVAQGIVTVDYWHYPASGINSAFELYGGLYDGSPESRWPYVAVWKNDGGLWWVGGISPEVATYSGQYTHIVITIDTCTGLFDLYIDESLVYQGTVQNADKIGTSGIRYVTVHSGHGGSGTDSYFDDMLITATNVEEIIVFASYRDGNSEIYRMNADGTGITRITNTPWNEHVPRVSPYGQKILFSSDQSGVCRHYIMDMDGTNIVALPEYDYDNASSSHSWSPDGTQVLFSTQISYSPQSWAPSTVRKMNADGTGMEILFGYYGVPSENHEYFYNDWSPDGTKIAFCYGPTPSNDCDTDIYVCNSDGTGRAPLTTDLAGNVWPAWSPDGMKIAFAKERACLSGDRSIYVMDADGSNPINLSAVNGKPMQDGISDLGPRWSADGTKICFYSNRSGRYHIYVMNADGTGIIQLTTGNHDNGVPDFYGGAPTPSPSCDSVATATGTGAAEFCTSSGTMGNLTAIAESTLPSEGKPNLDFPHGFFSFNVPGLTPGQAINVTITLPNPVPVGTQYWKWGPTTNNTSPHWYQLTPVLDDDGDNVIIITLQDKGLGDDIVTVEDSMIIDQGGPGNPPEVPYYPPVAGRGVPVFPTLYIGIAAALGAGVLAYLLQRRFVVRQ